MAGALSLALSGAGEFQMEWTHSVEKETWRETWAVEGGKLWLRRAAVKGSGAGMEPGPDGWFEDGFWIWEPKPLGIQELVLAASGETVSGWTICGADCITLGATADAPIVLRPCEAPAGDGG